MCGRRPTSIRSVRERETPGPTQHNKPARSRRPARPGGTTEISGSGDEWYILFGYKSTTFFLNAAYDPSTLTNSPGSTESFAFSYGHLEQVASDTEYNSDGTATGTVDTAHGLIYITAPWSDFGSQLSPKVATPVAESILDHVAAHSFEEVGTSASGGSLQSAASAGGTSGYTVGVNC